jgi:hypothetical protein
MNFISCTPIPHLLCYWQLDYKVQYISLIVVLLLFCAHEMHSPVMFKKKGTQTLQSPTLFLLHYVARVLRTVHVRPPCIQLRP